MYSKEQREKALALYDKCHSVTKVIQLLGYPESRQGLYLWLRQRNAAPKKKAERRRVNNSPDHPLHPSLETKLDILRRCFIEGGNVQLVSEETGYSRASIYTWRRKFQSGGPARLMNSKDDPRGKLNKGIPSSTNEIDSLKQQMLEMQLEIDILKETINVLKKDPGVSKAPLKNKEKAAIVDALKDRYNGTNPIRTCDIEGANLKIVGFDPRPYGTGQFRIVVTQTVSASNPTWVTNFGVSWR